MMALLGKYLEIPGDQQTAPFIDVAAAIPRLGLLGYGRFLIDTGCDRTTLDPFNVFGPQFDYLALDEQSRRAAAGIGGQVYYYAERALLLFQDDGGATLSFEADIDLWPRRGEPAGEGLSSILGRDLLNLCDLRLNWPASLIALEPLKVDAGGHILPP